MMKEHSEPRAGRRSILVDSLFRQVVLLPPIIFLAGMDHRAMGQALKPAEIAWLKSNAMAVQTVEAGKGFEELAPLKALLGEARIVALGEQTHGTREFFQMKHRLVEFLAKEMNFTIFSIEANMPESYWLNDFVLEGRGDPKALIRGMYFWTWDTEEVLDMVRWMRWFNQSGRGRIEFTGFDMQTPDVAMRIVTDYVKKVDSDLGALAEKNYDTVKKVKEQEFGGDFGVATGTFPAEVCQGKSIRFSGFIKTETITRGWAGLWWRVDGDGGVLAFDNMWDRGAKGTTSWTRYEINLNVAAEAKNINFGAIHAGDGVAWFDALQVEIDGKPFDPGERFDFDFEGSAPKGFFTGGAGYDVRVDDANARRGKKSLRMESTGEALMTRDGPTAAGAQTLCEEVLKRLQSRRDALAATSSAKETDWAIQNARVVLQAMQMRAGAVHRDRSMAENVKWILDHAPDQTKIVLWAHNGHVERSPDFGGKGSMGHFLDQWYGHQYVVIGFAAGEGHYTAISDGKLQSTNKLTPPPRGSVEHGMRSAGWPMLLLNLRQVADGPAESAWLREGRLFRSIGALATDEQFHPAIVVKLFDFLMYVDRTSATKPIKN
jgi:erythromycin esterase-like protein